MKCVVFGYGGMGCLGLEALLRHGFDVVAAVTHSDDPSGKEQIWWPSLASLSAEHGLPVHFQDAPGQPQLTELVASYQPKLLFSFYYRHMLRAEVLALAEHGGLNLHGSLLPRGRGRAPINWTLVRGETVTGMSLHYMVSQPDAGELVGQEAVEVLPTDTAYTLFRKLSEAGKELLDRELPRLLDGSSQSAPMDLAEGSYNGGRTPEDGLVRWSASAQDIFDLIRAVTHPYPGAFSELDGRRLLIWWAIPLDRSVDAPPGTVVQLSIEGVDVATGSGVLRLLTVQFEGDPEQPAISLFSNISSSAPIRLGEKESSQ